MKTFYLIFLFSSFVVNSRTHAQTKFTSNNLLNYILKCWNVKKISYLPVSSMVEKTIKKLSNQSICLTKSRAVILSDIYS